MEVRTKEQLELYLEMRWMNCLVRVIKQPEIHKHIPQKKNIFKKNETKLQTNQTDLPTTVSCGDSSHALEIK